MLSELCGRTKEDWPEEFDILVSSFKDYEYTDEEKKLIPIQMSTYHHNPELMFRLACAVENIYQPKVMLTGLPSTGKSTGAEQFAAITSRPFIRFGFNGATDVDEMLGVTHIDVSKGDFFEEGLIPRAYQMNNMVMLLDEPWSAPPEIMMCMQRPLEDDGCMMLANNNSKTVEGKFVHPGDNLVIMFADNTKGMGDMSGKFVGTQPQNTSTLDRVQTFIHVDFMSAATEVAALEKLYPEAETLLLESMVEVARLSREAYSQETLSIILSFRVLKSWVQHALALRNFKKSLMMAFINRLDDPSEREMVLGFVNTVFGD